MYQVGHRYQTRRHGVFYTRKGGGESVNLDFSNSIMWNPWHGCHKKSEGCKNCYVYSQDSKFNIDTTVVKKSKTQFCLPIQRDKYCDYNIKSNTLIKTCMTSDFFIEEADEYRTEALEIIQERTDLFFLIITKRPERIISLGLTNLLKSKKWEHVKIAITCENQLRLNERLGILRGIQPDIINKFDIFISPILERINMEQLSTIKDKIDTIYVAGENYSGARICRYEWVTAMHSQAKALGINFIFWDIGSNFWKGNKQYKILDSEIRQDQARKSGLIYHNQ